ncbi:hypothetical protein AMST5_01914 [freshwater sediment metagenome]|uniref:Uncharacterized protein n=1 Tax=freshwater sediment metagenome TaxID=556182 RepID=A0AA48RD41_9ZZZZ
MTGPFHFPDLINEVEVVDRLGAIHLRSTALAMAIKGAGLPGEEADALRELALEIREDLDRLIGDLSPQALMDRDPSSPMAEPKD